MYYLVTLLGWLAWVLMLVLGLLLLLTWCKVWWLLLVQLQLCRQLQQHLWMPLLLLMLWVMQQMVRGELVELGHP
jgi:hypothetical protein